MMEGEDFLKVVDLLETINRVSVSDLVIQYYVEKDLPSSFFNSLLLFFISERYILQESECLVLLGHLLRKEMKEELRMMDRVYPVTKLFFILQKIGSEEALNEILRLISKYKMFRGNKEKLVEELKKTNRQALKTAIRGCPDFLSFVDEIEGQLMTPEKRRNFVCDVPSSVANCVVNNVPSVVPGSLPNSFVVGKSIDSGRKSINDINDSKGTKVDTKGKLVAPSVLGDDYFHVGDVESSLHSLSISYRREFESPLKKGPAMVSLEDILDNLIDCDPEKSQRALRSLSDLVNSNISSVLFSANSIISSISIQLLDSSSGLDVLLTLSKSPIFCEHLRVETLESVHTDLFSLMKNKDLVQLVGDIITNFCLNSKPHISLRVYLSLLLKEKKDIPLKLLWRHSKNKLVNLQEIVDVLEAFYSKTLYTSLLEDPTTFKILTLHLKEMVLKYPRELETLTLKRHTKRLVGLLKEKKELNISELRK